MLVREKPARTTDARLNLIERLGQGILGGLDLLPHSAGADLPVLRGAPPVLLGCWVEKVVVDETCLEG